MSVRRLTAWFVVAPLLLGNGGCAVYEKYGHGIVVKSKLAAQATPVELPANAPTISQRFRPVNLPREPGHKGFDMLVPHRTPVLAAADGQVARVSLSVLYGKQLFINHARSAQGYRLQTRYFHLTERTVSAGQVVQRGQLIGYSGASGMAGVYPHLHFEVHRLDDADPAVAQGYLDPQLFWFDGVGKVTCFERGRDYAATPVTLTYPVPCRGLDWE